MGRNSYLGGSTVIGHREIRRKRAEKARRDQQPKLKSSRTYATELQVLRSIVDQSLKHVRSYKLPQNTRPALRREIYRVGGYLEWAIQHPNYGKTLKALRSEYKSFTRRALPSPRSLLE